MDLGWGCCRLLVKTEDKCLVARQDDHLSHQTTFTFSKYLHHFFRLKNRELSFSGMSEPCGEARGPDQNDRLFIQSRFAGGTNAPCSPSSGASDPDDRILAKAERSGSSLSGFVGSSRRFVRRGARGSSVSFLATRMRLPARSAARGSAAASGDRLQQGCSGPISIF
jgi:hypothetical protein